MRRVNAAVRRMKNKYNINGPLAAPDYLRICEGEKIVLITLPGQTKGFTFKMNGETIIYLRSVSDLQVFGHELGHVLLEHKGLSGIQDISTTDFDAFEREADLFSDLCLR